MLAPLYLAHFLTCYQCGDTYEKAKYHRLDNVCPHCDASQIILEEKYHVSQMTYVDRGDSTQ